MEFVDSVSKKLGHFRKGTFQMKQPHPHIQMKVMQILAKILKPIEMAMTNFFTSMFNSLEKKLVW